MFIRGPEQDIEDMHRHGRLQLPHWWVCHNLDTAECPVQCRDFHLQHRWDLRRSPMTRRPGLKAHPRLNPYPMQ